MSWIEGATLTKMAPTSLTWLLRWWAFTSSLLWCTQIKAAAVYQRCFFIHVHAWGGLMFSTLGLQIKSELYPQGLPFKQQQQQNPSTDLSRGMQHQQLKTHEKLLLCKRKQQNSPKLSTAREGKRIGLFILDREAKKRQRSEMSKIIIYTYIIHPL